MGIIKRAGDLVYTFRFLRLLTTAFEDTEAFKAGIIDKNGNRNKEFTLDTMDNRDKYKDYYTPFHRLVFNIKKIIAKAPGGSSKFASYATALYLLKEKFGISDKKLQEANEALNVDPLDLLSEQSEWFVLPDMRLSPGIYKVLNGKVLNDTLDEMVKVRDKIRVDDHCYPVGEIFGINIYEAIHIRTNKKIYVSIGELAR
jgi:hypothetical protein